MRIVQVATEDRNGGAVRVPLYLHCEYEKRGHESVIFVGEKYTSENFVKRIPNYEMRSKWAKLWIDIEKKVNPYLRFKGGWRIRELIRFIGQPKRQVRIWLGFEDFDYPGTKILLNIECDIINCHVLHGFWLSDRGYFDLRILPQLTEKFPVVLTLHDMWLFTGHCSHSIDCKRWENGCPKCPDITLPPQIRRDLSHKNWIIKREIYQKSKYWVIAPSQWMGKMAEKSILSYGMQEIRIIYNGIALKLFSPPKSKKEAKKKLGFRENFPVIITAGKALRTNRWKGFDIFLEAIKKISDFNATVIALGGGEGQIQNIGKIKLHLLPFEYDHLKVRDFLKASDIYVQASRAETFPLAILEAKACGAVPIVSNVGGMPEIIEEGTGLIFDLSSEKLAEALHMLLKNPKLLNKMRQATIEHSKKFDIKKQADEYLKFFEDIIEKNKRLNNRA